MPRPTAHRYSIEIKDVETGAMVVNATVDWTDDQRRLAIILIGRLASLYRGGRPSAFSDLGLKSGDQYH
ncbi:MAG: hypothetical protein ACREUF_03715 [Solimonas sp.]